MPEIKPEERVVFAISEDKAVVILGVPATAWEYMKDGKTHTFDLRRFGVPCQIILFGGKDQAEIRKCLNTSPDTLDVSGLDVGFGGKD
jgi:hypothetical protein